MKFEAKVFKLGNSSAVYIPKAAKNGLEVGKIYTFEVFLEGEKEEKEEKVYIKEKEEPKYIPQTPQQRWWCHKHGKWNKECGC